MTAIVLAVGFILGVIGNSRATAQTTFPVITQEDFVPNDTRLRRKIGNSKAGELTIASLSAKVRNLGSRSRSFKDYEALVDVIDEADVVVLQEVGLGVFDSSSPWSEKERERIDAIKALFATFLGSKWSVLLPPKPSGSGPGGEVNLLVHRTTGHGGSTISAAWKQYVDLGPSRDMAVFQLTVTTGFEEEEILVGSVHLTPGDPARGEEMIEAADWLKDQGDAAAVILGDFNWGYKKVSGVTNYLGEKHVDKLHEDDKVFQVFRELSYLGKAPAGKLRTNVGFRKGGYFYDQILMTPILAGRMADSGDIMDDCGIVAFDVGSGHMASVRKALATDYLKGVVEFKKKLPRSALRAENRDNCDKAVEAAEKKAASLADNNATWRVSDHRLVWVQIRVKESSL